MPWRDVVGHNRLTAWLARQVAAEQVSHAPLDEERLTGHAYLLVGPEGIGKRFLAGQFAQALLCGQSVEGDACGSCPMCRLVAQGHHPDLVFLEPLEGKRQIGIEQVRELQRWLSLVPFHGQRKVAIVNDADLMQESAASALLKTLEEPPRRTVLILVAAHERSLLPTIVSRCAKLYASPLPTADLVRRLREGGVPEPRAMAVARLATGRLGRALQLASEERWAARQAILDELRTAITRGELEPPTLRDGSRRSEPSLSSPEALRCALEEGLEALAASYRDRLRPAEAPRGLPSVAAPRPSGQRQAFEAVDAIYETHALIQQRVNPRTAIAALIARLHE